MIRRGCPHSRDQYGRIERTSHRRPRSASSIRCRGTKLHHHLPETPRPHRISATNGFWVSVTVPPMEGWDRTRAAPCHQSAKNQRFRHKGGPDRKQCFHFFPHWELRLRNDSATLSGELPAALAMNDDRPRFWLSQDLGSLLCKPSATPRQRDHLLERNISQTDDNVKKIW